MASDDNKMPTKILIIDDDSTVGQSIEGPLANYKIAVVNTQDLEASLYQFNNQDFDVVFVELEFEQLQGLALVQKLRNHALIEKRATSFVMMSGKVRSNADDNLVKDLFDVQMIIKPFSLIQILPYLSRGVAIKNKLRKIEQFRDTIQKLVQQNKMDDALELIRKNLGALGARGIQFMCETYETSGRYEDGLNFITPISEKERSIVLYQYLRGKFLKYLGRSDEALAILEACQKSTPHHLKRLQELGEIYLDMKMPEKAVERMKDLIKLNPDQPDMKFDMFKKLFDHGYDQAAQKFCAETTKPMEVVRFYNNKGVELSRAGDLPGAIREYGRALKFYPNFKENYRIHYNIALAYIKLKGDEDMKNAAKHLEQCLKLEPTFEKAQKALEPLRKNPAETPAAPVATPKSA